MVLGVRTISYHVLLNGHDDGSGHCAMLLRSIAMMLLFCYDAITVTLFFLCSFDSWLDLARCFDD